MKYYVISGETSGDQHASQVLSELKKLDTSAQFKGMAGDLCQAQGMDLSVHQKEMAIMGIWEVLINLRKINKVMQQVKAEIANWKPDALLLIDYPGFNLKIAKYAKKLGIPVHYYIVPKVWAWKSSRVENLKKDVDFLYSILPFEEEWLKARGRSSVYVGNPSKQAIEEKVFTLQMGNAIALLPGSRAQEIKRSFPIMLDAIAGFGDEVLVAQAPGFNEEFYRQFGDGFKLVEGDMHALLNNSKIALVTSGTATLETALMNVPQVVCYKMNGPSYQIAKRLVKLEHISLVNLILDTNCVTELIQGEFNAKRLQQEMNFLLNDEATILKMKDNYSKLRAILQDKKPSVEVAKSIFDKTN